MSVTFGAAFTVRFYEWADWKTVQSRRSLLTQYDEEPSRYTVYGYDGPEVHECIIEKTTPANPDQTDFETNYKPKANRAIEQRTTDGKPVQLQNQFPEDVLMYLAGAGDAPGGDRGAGPLFNLSSDTGGNVNLDFTFNDWVYLLGGMLGVEGGELGDWIGYQIYAAATPVTPNPGAGNCNLVDPGVGSTILIVPAVGGDYDVDLGNAFLVPAEDADGDPNGYYEWDFPDEGKGTISPGTPGASHYNLFTIQIDLVTYVARQPFLGNCDIPINYPVRPKIILPHWTSRVTLHNGGHAGLKSAWSLTTARKKST